MRTATLFTDGGNQAVRLPRDMRFEGVAEVAAERQGESIVLTPKPEPRQPEDNLPLGQAFARIFGEVGLTDEEFAALQENIARNRVYPKPVAFN